MNTEEKMHLILIVTKENYFLRYEKPLLRYREFVHMVLNTLYLFEELI